MLIEAEVLKEVSVDPDFKIKFSFQDDNIIIGKGYAKLVRKAPKPVITYDSDSDAILKNIDRSKLELELMNAVIGYMFSNGVARTWKGNVILNT